MAQSSNGNGDILLDSNVVFELFQGRRSKAIKDMLMKTPHQFTISYTQEETLVHKGLGDELSELEEMLGDRFSVCSSTTKYYSNQNVVFHDMIYWFKNTINSSAEKKDVRIRKLSPPQFRAGYINRESFKEFDEEDLHIMMDAARHNIPIILSFDRDMGALSLISTARRYVHANLGVQMPHIIPMDFALCGPGCEDRGKYCPTPNARCFKPDPAYPGLNLTNIEKMIEDWYQTIFERKPGDNITKHQYENYPQSIQAKAAVP